MPAKLSSRIPAIILELNPRVNHGVSEWTDLIVERAKDRVPVESGDLRDSIEAKDDGVYALWRWFFTEFGTTHSPAEPFMIPALEESRDEIQDVISDALRGL